MFKQIEYQKHALNRIEKKLIKIPGKEVVTDIGKQNKKINK